MPRREEGHWNIWLKVFLGVFASLREINAEPALDFGSVIPDSIRDRNNPGHVLEVRRLRRCVTDMPPGKTRGLYVAPRWGAGVGIMLGGNNPG